MNRYEYSNARWLAASTVLGRGVVVAVGDLGPDEAQSISQFRLLDAPSGHDRFQRSVKLWLFVEPLLCETGMFLGNCMNILQFELNANSGISSTNEIF